MIDWADLWSPVMATTQALTAPRAATLAVNAYVDHGITRADLQNGRKYFFQVRLTNSLAQQALLSSDGRVSRRTLSCVATSPIYYPI